MAKLIMEIYISWTTLTISVRKQLDRIKPNFVCMEIYSIETYAKILDKFYRVVFPAKFRKVVKMGDEDSALHSKMSVPEEKLAHF